MKARTRLKLLVVLVVAMAASLIAGCSIGMESYEETLALYNLTAQVTYYSNGGYFDSNTDVLVKRIGYKDGTPFYEVTSTTANAKVIYSNHIYSGWYYAASQTIDDVLYFECDLNGYEAADYYYEDDDQIVYCITEQNGKYLISKDDYEELILIRTSSSSQIVPLLEYGDEVDASSLVLADGDSLYMVAMWTTAQSIEYKLLIDGGDENSSITVTDEEGTATTYKQGDVIYTEYFGTQTSVSLRNDAVVDFDGYTWAGYYSDESCTTSVSGVARPDEDNVTLYVLYVEGSWTIVKDGSDVRSMFSTHNTDYYILNDIDCTGVSVTPMGAFSGYIEGNGHTISNLTITQAASGLDAGSTVAVFGRLIKNAKVCNVTFDNWQFNVTLRSKVTSLNVYLFAYELADASTNTLENVIFNECSINITNANSDVIINDGSYLTSYQCGGYTNGGLEGVTFTDCAVNVEYKSET